LHDPDVELIDLQHTLALDVGLSFRLLRFEYLDQFGVELGSGC